MKSLASKLKPGSSLLLEPCDSSCEFGLKQPGTQATVVLQSNFFLLASSLQAKKRKRAERFGIA